MRSSAWKRRSKSYATRWAPPIWTAAAGPRGAPGDPEGTDVTETADAPSAAAPSSEQLEAEVQRYKAQAEQHWQQFLHAAADLENYKKQAARAREDAGERARRALLTVILSP